MDTQTVYERNAHMAKYSAHTGMVNPKDSLCIEIDIETLKTIMNKWGQTKFKIGPMPSWDGIRIYPSGTYGFHYNPKDTRGINGRAAVRISEDANPWLKTFPPFKSSQCRLVIHEKYLDVMLPAVLEEPHRKNRRKSQAIFPGMLTTRREQEVANAVIEAQPAPIDYSSRQVRDLPVVTEQKKSSKPELFELVDKINDFKRQYGDGMIFHIGSSGFLKVMVEHGTDG